MFTGSFGPLTLRYDTQMTDLRPSNQVRFVPQWDNPVWQGMGKAVTAEYQQVRDMIGDVVHGLRLSAVVCSCCAVPC